MGWIDPSRAICAAVGGVLVLIGGLAASPVTALAASATVPEDLLVVDCLLPGQMRRLGGQANFLSARRPVRTTQADCAIRGGEYVAYDRADYRTAMKVWQGAAESGDAEAQNYVGEILMKGLGTAPDPVTAAGWFEKASAQGHRRAKANLALLLEQGQGMPADPLRALNLYRESAGAGDELLYASVVQVEFQKRDATIAAQREEIAALEQRVGELESELKQRRADAASARDEAERLRSELAEVRERAGADSADLQALRSRIENQESELQSLRERLASQREALKRREAEAALLSSVQSTDATAIEEQRQRVASAVQNGQASVAAIEAQLEASASGIGRERDAYAARVAELEATLEQRKQEDWSLMKLLEGQLSQRESVLREQQLTIVALEQQVALAGGALLAQAAPRLEVISPSLALTRSGGGGAARSAPGRQTVVGRVSEPQLVERLSINELPVVLADNGLFRASVDVPPGGLDVRIEALSTRGEMAELKFSLLAAEAPAASAVRRSSTPGTLPSSVKLGRYHALVIGNNRYSDPGFPALGSAVNDATAVAQLLRERYGYETRLLLNASRLDILSALADLRARLEPEDNLLVYYAGHGELSGEAREGFWIPVDARAGDASTWISNRAISDLLEGMASRHVLVVADSCYSGALAGAGLASYGATEPDADWAEWVRNLNSSRSRLALTSGGLQPVPDSGSGRHSYFARAFLNVLQDNNRVLEGARLYREINASLALAALDAPVSQVPRYAPIQFAGHEAGEFFFRPL
jgi:predicted  nucleic acid-binding Zn-ribbon protein